MKNQREQLIKEIEQQYSILDQILSSKHMEKSEREEYEKMSYDELYELRVFLCSYEKSIISGEVE